MYGVFTLSGQEIARCNNTMFIERCFGEPNPSGKHVSVIHRLLSVIDMDGRRPQAVRASQTVDGPRFSGVETDYRRAQALHGRHRL